MSGVPTQPTHFNISDIMIADNIYTSRTYVIKTHDFFYDEDGFIFMNNVTFRAVEFQLFGSCIKISQHIKHQVQIHTLNFDNTISGQIFIIPDNIKEERYPTSVRLINFVHNVRDRLNLISYFGTHFGAFLLGSGIRGVNFNGLNNNSKYSTLIRVEDGAHLDLTDSYFADNYSYERGGVMRCNRLYSSVNIQRTVFFHNSAVEGGIFGIYEDAFVSCTRCNVTENFAVDSGVVFALLNGAFRFIDSYIQDNLAYSIPLMFVVDALQDCRIANTTMVGNKIIHKQEFDAEIAMVSSCDLI
jgi:hypothetical protein